MENDDFLDTVETTGRINPDGGSITGIIGAPNADGTPESDWFAFQADADQIFQFMVDSGEVSLSIYDANGDFLFSSTLMLGGFRTSADLFFNAAEAGTYYLSVTPIVPRNGDGFTGPYSVSSVELFDDFGDDIASAEMITADGSAVEGRIDARGDFDYFAIDITEGQTLSVEAGTLGTKFYGLFDVDGNEIGGGLDGFEFPAEFTGTVYVRVSAFPFGENGSLVGDYSFSATLSQTEPDDFASDTSTTGVITPDGGSATGTIGPRNPDGTPESDWFAFEAGADQIFQFMVDSGNVTLDIYDAEGNFVYSSPTGFRGDATTQDLFFNPQEGGTYYLAVTGIIPRAGTAFTGKYSVSAVEVFDDFGDNIQTAKAIASDGATIDGRIDGRGDVDFFAVEITAGETLNFNAVGGGTDFYTLFNAAGEDLGGGVNNVAFTSDFTGTLYLRVSPFATAPGASRVGDYSFTVNSDANAAVIIDGTSGNDIINGTAAVDDIAGFDGNDLISGFMGNDKIFGGNGDDSLYGGAGDDELFGESGDDDLSGGNGSDYLSGGDGQDIMSGGAGDDGLFGQAGHDKLYAGSGDDYLDGGDGQDALFGGSGNDTLVSGSGDDNLYGGNEDDTLDSGTGDDYLSGGDGNDVLDGGAGNDLMFGGDGADVFIFQSGDGFDRIADFQSGEDRVDLSEFGFESFDTLNLVAGDNNNVFLYINAQQSIEFTDIADVSDLTADDFIL